MVYDPILEETTEPTFKMFGGGGGSLIYEI